MAGEVFSQKDQLSPLIDLHLRDLRTRSFRSGSAIDPVQMQSAIGHMLAAALRSKPNALEKTRYRQGAFYFASHVGFMIAELGDRYRVYGKKFTELGAYLIQQTPEELRRVMKDQGVTLQRFLYDTQENAVYRDLQEIGASWIDCGAVVSLPILTRAAKNVRIARWFLSMF